METIDGMLSQTRLHFVGRIGNWPADCWRESDARIHSHLRQRKGGSRFAAERIRADENYAAMSRWQFEQQVAALSNK